MPFIQAENPLDSMFLRVNLLLFAPLHNPAVLNMDAFLKVMKARKSRANGSDVLYGFLFRFGSNGHVNLVFY